MSPTLWRITQKFERTLEIVSLLVLCSACVVPSATVKPTETPAVAPTVTPSATSTSTATPAPTVAAEPPGDVPVPTATPLSDVPVALASGQFTRIDRSHAAEGTTTIYRDPDGRLRLRLEQDFRSNRGPDLYVGLSGHPMPRSNDELEGQGYLELALLTSIEGEQDYLLPGGLDLGAFKSVVIYCKAFTVLFSTAELVAP